MRTADKSMRGPSWSLGRSEGQALRHSTRTAVAAVAAVLAARLFRMPETHWAAITTLIVMQSNVGETLTVSVRRFAGTALGVILGALLATYFGANVFAFGAGIFLLGELCALMGRTHQRLPEYLERTAYRFGSVALAIVMLIARHDAAWVVALHRFIEVSIGIAVGLVLTFVWPERQPVAAGQSDSAERRGERLPTHHP